MLKLSVQNVELNATCHTKDEAIRLLAEKMATAGLIEPGYLAGMQEREQQTSTFLGSGIAIPHGTPETRDLVKKTGIQVIRFPKGVDWGNAQTVYTAIGIAAKSDDHLALLRQLTSIISNAILAERLHTAPTAEEVIKILSGEVEPAEIKIHPGNVRAGLDLGTVHEARALATAILCPCKSINPPTLYSLMNQAALELDQNISLVCVQDFSIAPAAAVVQFKTLSHGSAILIMILTNRNSHRKLLDHLLGLQQKQALERLRDSEDPMLLCDLLNGLDLIGQSVTCRIHLIHGLHARPATQLVRLVKSLGADIYVENLDNPNSEPVKANSLARLLSIGACFGHHIRFTVPAGPEAGAQLNALSTAVRDGLGDPIDDLSGAEEHSSGSPDASVSSSSSTTATTATTSIGETQITSPDEPPAPLVSGNTVYGLCGSPGIAIGPVLVEQPHHFEYDESATDIALQMVRLERATNEAAEKIKERINTSSDRKIANPEVVQIAEMHLSLLDDPALTDDANALIRQSKSAEWAWHTTCEQMARRQENNSDPLLAERAADFRDIDQQVLAILTGYETEANQTEPHILVCYELTPSRVSMLDPAVVRAVVTVVGGVTSHAAILARAAGIPLLVGCGERILTLTNGTMLIVTCDDQRAYLPKNDSEIEQARLLKQAQTELAQLVFEARLAPAITKDGFHMEVVANIASSGQLTDALEQGAEGIGLFRTEFLYMAFGQEPSVEQQTTEYKQALDELGERPFIVRTLDVGGDKPLSYAPIDKEDNPFLGVRGIRFSLREQAMLRRQLQALLTASSQSRGNLKIMFPMVSDISEWRQLKEIVREEANNLPEAQFELGMMIEVPSAALLAEIFAPELDFFSIGTNDLTQYTMAIDRGHPTLSAMADPLHPAVLKLIKMTVDAASRFGGWVGVCGELAADPLGAMILTGLGARELSVSVKAIPSIKARVRTISMTQAKCLADQAIAAESALAVRALHVEAKPPSAKVEPEPSVQAELKREKARDAEGS